MKQELRKKYLSFRNSFSPVYVENISEKIMLKIENFSYFQNANSIFVYVNFGTEIITTKLIEKYINKKRIFVPKIVDSEMKLVEIKSLSELTTGHFGILEPVSNDFYEGEVDLVLTPAVVFSKDGYRIGYGKGYYDRYFAKGLYKKSVGLTYSRLIQDELPTDEYDKKVDYIITDESIIKI